MADDVMWVHANDAHAHIIRMITSKDDEMGRACNVHGGDERCLQNFGLMSEGKRPLGRPRHRWEDNIKMDLRETGLEGVDWIHLA
jgi:hypothetical protein